MKSIISYKFSLLFCLIVFTTAPSYAVILNKVMICTDKNFIFEKDPETKIIKELTCGKEILENEKIKIDSFNRLYAVVHVSNLKKLWDKGENLEHKKIQIHWVFTEDPLNSESSTITYENTFYESEYGKFADDDSDKFKTAEKMYEGSNLVTYFAVVEVLISVSNNFRTYSSKEFNKNLHVGEWELLIYEKGRVENGQAVPLANKKFEIVN